jgi:parallel beta-helix repeat protein
MKSQASSMNIYRLSLLALALSAVPATAATLCVNPNGGQNCSRHISDAVAAAAPGDIIRVSPGIYKESVTITKPLSLVGQFATIDAAGLTRGIFVDGIDSPGLTSVHISGFTIQNAQYEGVLVANASAVTVSGNTVLNNNKNVVDGNCTNLPPIEPGEAQDCGEGIHLMGADHSIVTNNTVQNNAGGILISDDTAATHDNLISYNTVTDNPWACGITMASHVPSAVSGSGVPLGVFHNTVFGNRSQRNGLKIGGGAGVGIFASIPGAKSYGNVVVSNLVSENGLPGIAMHAHAPGQNLNDNMIVGNTARNNGPDTADAATPGTTGINLYSLTPVTGNIISGNNISNQANSVVTNNPAAVQVEFNTFQASHAGVNNLGAGPVDATNNWWNCGFGPTIPGACAAVLGNNVLSDPWLTTPPPPQPFF